MTDPAVVRAALTPVIQAAVLDAFKLGVGHAIGAIEDRSRTPRIGIRNAGLVLDGLAAELRAYVAELTYEGMP